MAPPDVVESESRLPRPQPHQDSSGGTKPGLSVKRGAARFKLGDDPLDVALAASAALIPPCSCGVHDADHQEQDADGGGNPPDNDIKINIGRRILLAVASFVLPVQEGRYSSDVKREHQAQCREENPNTDAGKMSNCSVSQEACVDARQSSIR